MPGNGHIPHHIRATPDPVSLVYSNACTGQSPPPLKLASNPECRLYVLSFRTATPRQAMQSGMHHIFAPVRHVVVGGRVAGLFSVQYCWKAGVVQCCWQTDSPIATGTKPSVVFVVDDEHVIADMLSLILRAAGLQVTTFYDGSEVLLQYS